MVGTEQVILELVAMVVLEAEAHIMEALVVLEQPDKVTLVVLVEQTLLTTSLVEAAVVKAPLVEAQAMVQLVEQVVLDRHHQSLVHL